MVREELVRNLDDTTRRSGHRAIGNLRTGLRDKLARQPRPREDHQAASVSDVGGTGADAAIDTSSPPARWKKEAAAESAKCPKTVQEGSRRGAKPITSAGCSRSNKNSPSWAKSSKLSLRVSQAIQKFGHRPGARGQPIIFVWFQAYLYRPDEAFPALMQSFNYDPRRLAQVTGLGGGAQQQQALTAEQQYNQAAVQAVQRMIDEGIGRHVGPIQQQFESQRQAQTEEILANWAKGKKHYEKVRGMMSRLLMPPSDYR